MKKILANKILIFVALAFLLLYVGGSATALTEANNKVDELTKKLENSETERRSVIDKNNIITKEYNEYKEKMRPFEKDYQQNLEKKKKEEAEQEEKKRAAAKAKLAELEKKKAEEEKKGYETGITFDNLARNPKDYTGKKVKLSGKVIQVSKGTSENQLRVAIGNNYDTVVVVGYTDSITSQNVLENDQITFYGVSIGEYTYQSTMGASITVPGVMADKIEFN